jgi:two-component system, OmpR family, response regulator CpxR
VQVSFGREGPVETSSRVKSRKEGRASLPFRDKLARVALARILIVDDDVELAALLSEYLGQEGFEVELAHDGETGLARARSGEHALVILDVMLPRRNGFEVLRALRETSRVPVLMLTARGEPVDRIVGLEMGADDYLAKPFDPRELAARLRAIHRRATDARADREVLEVGDVTLDVGARAVRRGGEEIPLTTAEFALLEMLLRSAGRVVERELIAESVLGRRLSPYDRSVDVHVSNLRKKLGLASGRERIKTVRGAGYVYVIGER